MNHLWGKNTMESGIIKSAIDLILEQYREMTGREDTEERVFLRNEAQIGVDKLGAACRTLFGAKLDPALHHAILRAQEINEHAYSALGAWQDEGAKIAANLRSRELAGAARLLHGIQRKQGCSLIAQSRSLVRGADHYAKKIHGKIDPNGILCPKAADPIAKRNLRDTVREELIYRARKADRRTYADIGRELGISASRVAQIYRKVDYERNGPNADHHQGERCRRAAANKE